MTHVFPVVFADRHRVAIGGAIVAWLLHTTALGSAGDGQARRDAERILEDAERESRTKLREAEVAAKEKLLQARGEFEKVSQSAALRSSRSRAG